MFPFLRSAKTVITGILGGAAVLVALLISAVVKWDSALTELQKSRDEIVKSRDFWTDQNDQFRKRMRDDTTALADIHTQLIQLMEQDAAKAEAWRSLFESQVACKETLEDAVEQYTRIAASTFEAGSLRRIGTQRDVNSKLLILNEYGDTICRLEHQLRQLHRTSAMELPVHRDGRELPGQPPETPAIQAAYQDGNPLPLPEQVLYSIIRVKLALALSTTNAQLRAKLQTSTEHELAEYFENFVQKRYLPPLGHANTPSSMGSNPYLFPIAEYPASLQLASVDDRTGFEQQKCRSYYYYLKSRLYYCYGDVINADIAIREVYKNDPLLALDRTDSSLRNLFKRKKHPTISEDKYYLRSSDADGQCIILREQKLVRQILDSGARHEHAVVISSYLAELAYRYAMRPDLARGVDYIRFLIGAIEYQLPLPTLRIDQQEPDSTREAVMGMLHDSSLFANAEKRDFLRKLLSDRTLELLDHGSADEPRAQHERKLQSAIIADLNDALRGQPFDEFSPRLFKDASFLRWRTRILLAHKEELMGWVQLNRYLLDDLLGVASEPLTREQRWKNVRDWTSDYTQYYNGLKDESKSDMALWDHVVRTHYACLAVLLNTVNEKSDPPVTFVTKYLGPSEGGQPPAVEQSNGPVFHDIGAESTEYQRKYLGLEEKAAQKMFEKTKAEDTPKQRACGYKDVRKLLIDEIGQPERAFNYPAGIMILMLDESDPNI